MNEDEKKIRVLELKHVEYMGLLQAFLSSVSIFMILLVLAHISNAQSDLFVIGVSALIAILVLMIGYLLIFFLGLKPTRNSIKRIKLQPSTKKNSKGQVNLGWVIIILITLIILLLIVFMYLSGRLDIPFLLNYKV